MKNVRILFVFSFVLLLAASCKKGDNGRDGVNGNTILSGNAAPAASLGNTGDFYIDLTASILYGPKTAAGWGSGNSLKGPQGNANVLTDSFTVKPADWLYGSVYWVTTGTGSSTGYNSKYYDRTNAKITGDILNHGLVLVYYKSAISTNPNQWQPLPFAFIEGFNGYAYNWAYETSPGSLRLYFYFTKVSAAAPSTQTYTLPESAYKIVVISGAAGNGVIQALKKTNTGIN